MIWTCESWPYLNPTRKQTVLFDFDWVIHKYSKWRQNGDIYDEPVEGIKECIDELKKDYIVGIFTTRTQKEEIKRRLDKHWIVVDWIFHEKIPAMCYIDDRGINFDGDVKNLAQKVKNFKTWQEK